NPFDRLKQELADWQSIAAPVTPPFQGGAAALFGYDLCHWLERLPRAKVDGFEVPDFAAGIYDWVIAWDHSQDRAWLISTGYPAPVEATRRKRAEQRLRHVLNERNRVVIRPDSIHRGMTMPRPEPSFALANRSGVYSNFDRANFVA